MILESEDLDRTRGANVYFSYQPAANGTDFEIRQIQFEGTATNLLNDDFIVTFVPFENQLAPSSPLSINQLGTVSSPNSGLSQNGIAITLNADGTVAYAYSPNDLRGLAQGQIIMDTFVYRATDGVASNSATATVTLRGFNGVPFITNAIPSLTFVEDGLSQTINLANHFSDFDTTDVLTYTVSINGNLSATATISGSILTVTPKADQHGAFSFTVTARDGTGATVTSALVTGDVTPVADGARSVADIARTTKFSPVDIAVLSNDFDPENSSFSVAAANIAGNIAATSDATTVWSVLQTSAAPNNIQVVGVVPSQNLGDLGLNRNGVALQQSEGVLLATVADDTTPYGTVNTYGDILNATAGYFAATDTGTGAGGERNAPLAAAYFPFADGWTSGQVNNVGQVRSGVGVTQANIVRTAAGLFEVTIPEATNSETSGYLYAMTASNDDNIMSVRPIPGTNKWQVRNTDNDNASDTTGVANLEDDGFSFVYIPATTPGLIGGRWAVNAGTGSLVQSSGGTTATTDAAGTVTVSIPGHTPSTGALIAIGSGGASATVSGNSITLPANLAVSYVASGNDFSVRLRSGGTFAQAIGDVQFLFVPFASPLERLAPNPYSVTSTSATSTLGAAVSINANGTIKYDPLTAGGVIAALNPGESIVDSFTYTITDSNGKTSTSTVSVTVTGDRVVVSPFTGLVTNEAGGTASFSVSLSIPPTADVIVAFTSSDETEGITNVSSLTFTSANWNTPQVVVINGVDDKVVDGNIAYTILTTATSADANFSGVSVIDLSVVNNDNDVAGISVTPSTGLVTTERGGTANFSAVLTSEPTSDVSFAISSNDSTEGTVLPASITFTAANWNVPQLVTVTGVNDALFDADIAYSIVTAAAVSSDPNYSGRDPANVSLVNTNLDIDAVASAGATQYGVGSVGIGVDGRIAFPGTGSFLLNGTLTVSVTGNANANDRLELRNEGTGAGQVGVSGANVTYAGAVIGSFAGGVGAPLVITFNATANRISAQAVARAVTYRDVTVDGLGSRTISFALVDGDGQVSPVVQKVVSIGLKRVYEIQEGVDRGFGTYTGAKDIQLTQASPTTTFPTGGDASGLLVDFADPGVTNTAQVLMRFENLFGSALGQIPAGAIITSASLFVQTNNTGDGAEFHRMLTDWNPTTSTWTSVGGGIQVDDSQARSSYDSFWNTQDVSGATGTGYASVAVTNDIRAWNSGATNFGWLLNPFLGGTDGWAFSPSEAADTTLRPMLKIEWVPAGTNSVVFQQGLNGYTSAVDTQLLQSLPSTPLGGQESIGSDYEDAGGANRTQALIRFEDIIGNLTGRIPVNARIDQAVLTLTNGGNNAVGHGGSFHAMLADWNTNSTWDSMVSGVEANGVEASTTITTQAGNSTRTPLAQGGINDFEVTADLQNWVRGTSNKGWAILPWTNGTDGWFLYSSDYVAVPSFRPELEVFFTELPNNAPTDILVTPSIVNENLPADTVVGTLSSIDPDAGNTFTYELVTGAGDTDNSAFKIVNGAIVTNAIFDFESKPTYTIRVRSTDQGGQLFGAKSFEKALTISVGNVNDAAPIVTTSSTSVTYNGVAVPVDSGIIVSEDGGTLAGASIRVSAGHVAAEDVLSFVNTSTITGSYDSASGLLSLAGTDSVANYQIALRSVTYKNNNATPAISSRTISFQVDDGSASNNLSNVASSQLDLRNSASVGNRGVFYNRLDGTTLLATDKSALLPGQSSTFANYTNYILGLNGLVFDVAGLPATTTEAQMAASLQFANWNGIDAGNFVAISAAAVPTVRFVAGAPAGSSRVQVTFPNNTLQNTWLRVTVLANANTALPTNDIFYFGNVIGDFNVGNTGTRLRVNAVDTGAVRSNQSILPNSVDVTNIYDVNRDGRVNAVDTGLVRSNQQIIGIVAPITAPAARGESGFGTLNSRPLVSAPPVKSPNGLPGEIVDIAIIPMATKLEAELPTVATPEKSASESERPILATSAVAEEKPASKLESLDEYFATLWQGL